MNNGILALMAKEPSQSETRDRLNLREIEASSLESFAYLDRDVNIRYDWHAHVRHQHPVGEYPAEAEGGRLLPLLFPLPCR